MADSMCEPRLRPVNILLVDGDDGAAQRSREAFRAAQTANSVTVVGDGDEALRMLRCEPPHSGRSIPDLVLLDINLRKHGLQLEEIDRDCFARRIPIVVMTSSAAEVDTAKRYPVRAKSYIVKPVNVETVEMIIALIADAAAQRNATTPELSIAERELSEFSYNVSHDLAAPLRHIAAFSTLLTRSLGPGASSDQVDYCEQLQRSTQKCQAMLDGLLSFSRAQQAHLMIETCNATLLMEVAMLQLSAEVKTAGADIAIEPLGKANVDSALMTLGFKHALSNAIKFRLSDEPLKINVSALAHDGVWTVRIADNGRGVALERQEKLFRMFYQDEPEGTVEGVGAGLAILQRIVRRHGGSAHFIEAEQGACLELSLPETSPQPVANGAA